MNHSHSILIMAAILLLPSNIFADELTQKFGEATEIYRSALETEDRNTRLERFERAELLFSQLAEGEIDKQGQIIRPRIQSALLQVNIGNAALQAEHLGPAILAFRRALVLDPDYQRAQQNLVHARTLLPSWVPRPENNNILDTFFSWRKSFSTDEQSIFASIMFFVMTLFLALSIRLRRDSLRNLSILPALVWLILVGNLISDYGGSGRSDAVVIVPETIVRAADSSQAPPRLSQPLPSGTEMQVLRRRGNWTQIRLADGRDGWVRSSALAEIYGG